MVKLYRSAACIGSGNLLRQLRVVRMARCRGDHMAAYDAGEAQVTDDVEDLVAHELILEVERIEPAFIVVDDDVLERAAEAEAADAE